MFDAAPDLVLPRLARHGRTLPLRVGTRGSPLALVQTRGFIQFLAGLCPALRDIDGLREHVIDTTGDRVLDRRLADIGGKGLFAKEIHEALLDRRIDLAVHSLKDLETTLPDGIVLACVLPREDARDAIILPPLSSPACGGGGPREARWWGHATDEDPFASLPQGALIGTSSVRRQAQLLHARPDLRITTLRGNVQTRLRKLREGVCAASMLAFAGLHRLGLEHEASVILGTDAMVPAACQGIVGITARADDTDLLAMLAGVDDTEARAAATAERAMLAVLDGSCRTPIGAHATLRPDGALTLVGLVARADGSFHLRRALSGLAEDAQALGEALGESLRADSPANVFAP